jgi:hypothetical protein
MMIWEWTFLILLAVGFLDLLSLLLHGSLGSRNEGATATLWSVFFSAAVVDTIIYYWIIPKLIQRSFATFWYWASVILVLCSLLALSMMLLRGLSGKSAGAGILAGVFFVALGISALIYFVVLKGIAV